MSMSFENTGTLIDDPRGNREPAWDKEINWFEIPDDNDVHAYRLVAGPFFYSQHWVQTKKRDGQNGKSFPALCKNWDSETNTYAENGCELCRFLDEVNKTLAEVKKTNKDMEWKNLPAMVTKMSRRLVMATNIISRDIQQAGPPSNNAAGWSFIRPVRFPQGFAKTLKDKQEKFNKRNGEVYALSHVKEGRDIFISYNSQEKEPSKKYSLDLGDVTPLTEEEMGHGHFLTDFKSFIKYPKDEELTAALRRFGYYDWLNEFKSSTTMISVPRTSSSPQPVQQQPIQQQVPQNQTPPQQAQTVQTHQAVQQPVQVQQPANPNAAAFSAASKPDPVFEQSDDPEPAATQVAPAQPAQQSVQQPAVQQAAQPAVQQPVQPQQPVDTAPISGTPQSVPQSNPAPTAKPAQDAQARILEFLQKTGVQSRISDTQYSKSLRFYQPGMTVPSCWELYNRVSKENREQCRQCALRLDCMMVSG